MSDLSLQQTAGAIRRSRSKSFDMRTVTLLVILAGGLFYTWVAFADLNFLSRAGRLGPGFFPRFIGAGIVLMTLVSLVDDLRRKPGTGETDIGLSRSVAMIMGLALLYLVAMWLAGGVVASVVFLFAALSVFNRGRLVSNIAVSLAMPLVIYLLFVVLLNADMPEGVIALPF